MDDTEFRVLDTLSRDPGRDVSISELTRDIRRLHGTAYYANTYKALHKLREEGIVRITKTGNSSLVSCSANGTAGNRSRSAATAVPSRPVMNEKPS